MISLAVGSCIISPYLTLTCVIHVTGYGKTAHFAGRIYFKGGAGRNWFVLSSPRNGIDILTLLILDTFLEVFKFFCTFWKPVNIKNIHLAKISNRKKAELDDISVMQLK